jgi:hypothetical protein
MGTFASSVCAAPETLKCVHVHVAYASSNMLAECFPHTCYKVSELSAASLVTLVSHTRKYAYVVELRDGCMQAVALQGGLQVNPKWMYRLTHDFEDISNYAAIQARREKRRRTLTEARRACEARLCTRTRAMPCHAYAP